MEAGVFHMIGVEPRDDRPGCIPAANGECAFEEQTGIPRFFLYLPIGLGQGECLMWVLVLELIAPPL